MAKTKISEFSATPANNTDIDSINISEGCAPSGINDAIRELMAQLKDFQTGAQGDSFNGPIGTSTAAAGAFTTLSATGAITSTLATGTAPLVIASTTKVSNLNVDLLDGADWASPAALGSTTPAAVSATTLSASSTVTLSGGTANGVAYLNGSKVVTSGSALTFDGSRLLVGTTTAGVVSGGIRAVHDATEGSPTGVGDEVGWVQRNFNSAQSCALAIVSGTASTSSLYFGDKDSINVGSVVYSNSDNSMRFNAGGSEVGRFTSTGLGIGTSSPTNKLDILTGDNTGLSVRSTNYSGTFGPSGLGGMALTAAGAYPLFFYINGATRATLDSSGNLGLGVTPSAWGTAYRTAIQVGAAACFTGTSGSSATDYFAIGGNFYLNSSASYRYITTAAANRLEASAGEFRFYNAPSGTAGDAITFTQAMTLDASGNLALGSTSILGSTNRASFTNNVSARGVLALSNTSSSGYSAVELYDNAGGQQGAIGWGNGSVAVTGAQNATYLYSSGAITFLSGGTSERARIDSSGNLLVNTTAVGGKLYVVSDLTSNNGIRIDTPSSFTATNILSLSATAGSTSWNHIAGNGNGGSQTNFIIYGNGNMVNANNSYGAVSDVKLKENIVDASPKLADLMQVKVRNYNLIGETTRQIGVVAQELETVFPSMIDETVDKDQDGNSLGTTTKQVKYSVFVPMLIKAIQEQQAIINSLKARLDAANL